MLGAYSESEKGQQPAARIAELEAANRWIPVSERLPRNEQIVLASSRGWSWFEAQYRKGTGGNFYWWHFAADDSADNVTHWMEITPPEVQS